MSNTERESEELQGRVDRGTKDIVCTDCGTCPRLKSLNKNDGTQTMCDCDDIKKSMDSVPYELGVSDLPESWVVVEGRTARQLAREVDLIHESGGYECPECGNEWGLKEGRVSCEECGHIPESERWTPQRTPRNDGS